MKDLDLVAEQLLGKSHRPEIRDHCTAEITARTAGTDTGMSLAYQRATTVIRFLIDKHGFPKNRFRPATAGDSEPIAIGDAESARKNSRAEEFLLDETVDGLRGASTQRNDNLDLNREEEVSANS